MLDISLLQGHRVIGPTAGRIWNFGFGLDKIKPGLAQHLTVGKFGTGLVIDVLVGGLIQGISDQYYYNLWSTNPGLATRRVGAAGGTNATYGAVGTVGSVAIIGGAAWFFGLSTPPGWVFTAGAVVIAT
jgi:hypothetical protein